MSGSETEASQGTLKKELGLIALIFLKSKNQWAVWLFVIAIIGGLVLYYIKKKVGLVRKPEILTD